MAKNTKYKIIHCKERFVPIFEPLSLNSSSGGFTLLELTISITMIGFIVLIIVGALSLGFRSVESGEKKIESFERVRSSINIINAQIQSQIPLKFVNEDGEEENYFKGESGFMQFATNYSIWGGEKGYVIATYVVENDENGKQMLFVTENVIGMNEYRDVRLFEKVDRIYFEYFVKSEIDEEGFWTEYLQEKNIIPEKIRLHLVNGYRDFSMIIPVMARGSTIQLFEAKQKFIGPFTE